MSGPLRLRDCQNERPYEPVDPNDERATSWVDEHGEPHPRGRRSHSVREFVLALGEAALLLAVVTVIVALFYVVFG